MKKLLVFTDLDGSLLDHQNYDWSAAQPALHRLAQLGFPLIFNTSKTLAELIPFSQELNNHQPMICENGNVAAIPEHYFEQTVVNHTNYNTHLFGNDYQSIITTLQQLRNEYGFQFSGFYDLGIAGVMEHTGLSHEKAALACQRLCSEPLLWQGCADDLITLQNKLAQQGLSLTRGGRFYHVMSPVNKGKTMAWLLARFENNQPETEWISVALGDGPNDLQMLEAAEHSVLIRNPHSTPPDVSHINNILTPLPPGPAGWNEAVNQIIDLYL